MRIRVLQRRTRVQKCESWRAETVNKGTKTVHKGTKTVNKVRKLCIRVLTGAVGVPAVRHPNKREVPVFVLEREDERRLRVPTTHTCPKTIPRTPVLQPLQPSRGAPQSHESCCCGWIDGIQEAGRRRRPTGTHKLIRSHTCPLLAVHADWAATLLIFLHGLALHMLTRSLRCRSGCSCRSTAQTRVLRAK
jgi:hypothetical protein